jgi:SAM domain (Sterile alpha motif)
MAWATMIYTGLPTRQRLEVMKLLRVFQKRTRAATATVNSYPPELRQRKQAFVPMHDNHQSLRARVRTLLANLWLTSEFFLLGHPNRILTPTIHGANQLYAWPFVPYNGQMVNSQSTTSLVPCPVAPSSSHTNVYSFGRAAFSTASLPPLGTRSPTLSSHGGHQHVHPACWTVQETVHWLRSKGFEEAVCQRFVEQEIAGDALLNLDVSKLKTEVGIVAYGKRVRIDNAIAECRRLARQMSSLAIQPMRHGSTSPVDLPAQQSTARARAPLPSASAGNLLGSMSPPDPGNLRKVSSMPGPNRSRNRSKDKPRGRVEGQSITDKPDATVGLRLWVSSLLSSDGGHGETAVSVHFWLDMWKSFIDDL